MFPLQKTAVGIMAYQHGCLSQPLPPGQRYYNHRPPYGRGIPANSDILQKSKNAFPLTLGMASKEVPPIIPSNGNGMRFEFLGASKSGAAAAAHRRAVKGTLSQEGGRHPT